MMPKDLLPPVPISGAPASHTPRRTVVPRIPESAPEFITNSASAELAAAHRELSDATASMLHTEWFTKRERLRLEPSMMSISPFRPTGTRHTSGHEARVVPTTSDTPTRTHADRRMATKLDAEESPQEPSYTR